MRKRGISSRVKSVLINSHMPPLKLFEHLNGLLMYGKWLRENPSPTYFNTREEMYDHVHSLIADGSYDYLEFGVFQGKSMKHWAGLSDNPENRYFGFDTFTGLPEAWDTGLSVDKKGTFDVGGALPDIKDSRVSFIKGLFQETLSDFLKEYKSQKNLVIHFDADLYSAELFLLTMLHPFLVRGTYLLFDNFDVPTHDFRAFVDYAKAYNREFEVVATSDLHCGRIAIKLV